MPKIYNSLSTSSSSSAVERARAARQRASGQSNNKNRKKSTSTKSNKGSTKRNIDSRGQLDIPFLPRVVSLVKPRYKNPMDRKRKVMTKNKRWSKMISNNFIHEKYPIKRLKRRFSSITGNVGKEKAQVNRLLEDFQTNKYELRQGDYKCKMKKKERCESLFSTGTRSLVVVERSVGESHLELQSIKKEESEMNKCHCFDSHCNVSDVGEGKVLKLYESKGEFLQIQEKSNERMAPISKKRWNIICGENDDLSSVTKSVESIVNPIMMHFDERVEQQWQRDTAAVNEAMMDSFCALSPLNSIGPLNRTEILSSLVLHCALTPKMKGHTCPHSTSSPIVYNRDGTSKPEVIKEKRIAAVSTFGTESFLTVAPLSEVTCIVPPEGLTSLESGSFSCTPVSHSCPINNCSISICSEPSVTLEQWFREGNTITGSIDFDEDNDDCGDIFSLVQDKACDVVPIEQVTNDMRKVIINMLNQVMKDIRKGIW
eukprot:CAMPEP_0172482996 /NCGR_PEP_ID=MMETSP1066-20121228/9768_1 /TAXON_ID=671091 /ORGANISM="Coscinodiscus wailesii, Strain CCMP2513" /LENGTH=484 /DNA_ID=CAMNT_0013246599 /DNA_START=219 /DNA_END=1670 /DNA_ORIENTATION=-